MPSKYSKTEGNFTEPVNSIVFVWTEIICLFGEIKKFSLNAPAKLNKEFIALLFMVLFYTMNMATYS